MTDIIEHDDVDYCSTHHAHGNCYECEFDASRSEEGGKRE
jgi:hypothetical protein